MVTSELMSILRIFSANPGLLRSEECPRYKDSRTLKISTLFKGFGSVFSDLLKKIEEFFTKYERELAWPFTPASLLPAPAPRVNVTKTRAFIVPHSTDTSCNRVELNTVESSASGASVSASGSADGKAAPGNAALVTLDDLKAFAGFPLRDIAKAYCAMRGRTERGLSPVSDKLAFDVSKHRAARTHVAATVLERLKADVSDYAALENNGTKFELRSLFGTDIKACVDDPSGAALAQALSTVQKLLVELEAVQNADMEFVTARIKTTLQWANKLEDPSAPSKDKEVEGHQRLSFALSRYAGQEPTIWFEYLVATLLSSKAVTELTALNPFLSTGAARRVFDLAVGVMCRANRVGHVRRCMLAARTLQTALKQLTSNPKPTPGSAEYATAERGLALHASTLADQLAMKRQYIKVETIAAPGPSTPTAGAPGTPTGAASAASPKGGATRSVLVYDPRFLMFEFTYNLVLRESQVILVKKFVHAASNPKGAICHQMSNVSSPFALSSLPISSISMCCVCLVMGAGKTTVVCPLLVLLMADGKFLITQVMPQALLEFSRGILRSRFSAIIHKPIYTFEFDRFHGVGPDLYRKLLKVRYTRGVVVATPTAVRVLHSAASFFFACVVCVCTDVIGNVIC